MRAIKGKIESLSYREDGSVKGMKVDGKWYSFSSKTEVPSFELKEGAIVELEVGNKNWVNSVKLIPTPTKTTNGNTYKNGNGKDRIDDLERQIIISRLSLLSTAKELLSMYPDRMTDDPVKDVITIAKDLEKYVFAHLAKKVKEETK